MAYQNFIYTGKKHPEQGIMSFIMGILSIGTYAAAIYLSYQQNGNVSGRIGAAGILATVFMLAGFVLGIRSFGEKERFKLFPVLGLIFNVVAFFMLSIILYAGAYVNS